jgi:hypothetical protein
MESVRYAVLRKPGVPGKRFSGAGKEHQRCILGMLPYNNNGPPAKGENIMAKLHRILRLLVCIGLVATFLGCAATQKRQSTGEYVDDSVITTKVKAAIFNEPTLKTLQINVETRNGVVQLSGFVDSAQAVNKAREVARSVKGVVSVKNDLIVK